MNRNSVGALPRGWRSGMSAALLLACPLSAMATLTDSLTIGNPKALALGHAVTADPPGIDSVHFNPAGLAFLEGRQSHLKVVAGTFAIDMKFGEYDDATAAMIAPHVGQPYYQENDAHNSSSTTEGASLMLPFFGSTDIPAILAPLGGASYKPPGSKMTFATNVYSPMMVGFYRAEDDPGRWIGQRMSFMLISYFSPSIAVELSDDFIVGAALTFNYGGVAFELPFRAGNPSVYSLGDLQQPGGALNCGSGGALEILCEGNFSPFEELGYLALEVEKPLLVGFNAGLLWKATDWLTFGATYIAPIPMTLEGDFSWKSADAWISVLGPVINSPYGPALDAMIGALGFEFPRGEKLTKGTLKLEMEMPEQIMFGTSVQLTSNWKLNLDYKFAGWSSWSKLPLELSESIDFLRIAEFVGESTSNSLVFPLGLKDTWNWAMGVEYRWSDDLVLRAGIEDRPTSLSKGNYSPLLPMGSGRLYGAGFGLKTEDGAQMDFGVGYFANELKMPAGTSPLGNDTDPLNFIYNPYFGTDIKTNLSMFLVEFSYSQQF